uniref:Chitin-binding type-2 domain-containing protein n=1 Tax=Syphacia muris TaxID=451379 RepID=A0A0N5AT43_9BILA
MIFVIVILICIVEIDLFAVNGLHTADQSSSLNYKYSESRKYLRPCYFTNWAQYRKDRGKFVPEDYVPGLCTHVFFAFGWMNENFTVRAYDPADLPNTWAGEGMYARVNKLKLIDPDLKTLLSFGGWTFGVRLFQQMAQTAENRARFITTAIAFVRQHNFDGIDIDWEYPKTEEDKTNYSLFIKEMRKAVEEEAFQTNRIPLLITAAVSAGESTIKNAYDIPEISQYFDFVLLMSYDFHGAWEPETGMNSPLFGRSSDEVWKQNLNIEFAAKYWIKNGMPLEKLVIGIPTYGRGWTLKDPINNNIGSPGSASKTTNYVGEAGVIAYYEICELLANGAERYWDDEQKVPYLVYGDQWFSYDDEESIRLKVEWIKYNGFGGAFVWTLDFDDFNGQCSNGNGVSYPLIGIIAEELSNVKIPNRVISIPGTIAPPIAPVTIKTTTECPVSSNLPEIPLEYCKRQPNGFYGHPSSCSYFVLCLNSKEFCINPYSLHTISIARKTPYMSKCSPELTQTTAVTRSTPPHVSRTAKKFVCKQDGFYPDEENCKRFYRCYAGIKYPFDCPNGLHFNAETLLCDHAHKTPCY